VATDSFLRLISHEIRESIERGSAHQRRAFGVACADFAIARLPPLVATIENFDETALRVLHREALAAMGSGSTHQIDELLRRREDQFYEALCALRAGDASAPYSAFVRVSSWRHVLRTIRALLSPNGTSVAARAAFETICATREEDGVIRLARELFVG
jgi:hypothetical protein